LPLRETDSCFHARPLLPPTAFALLYLPIPIVLIGAGAAAIALGHSAPALAASLFIGAVFLCLLCGIALVIIQNTLQSIFLTACYRYATTGEVPSPFTPEYVVAAWRPKRNSNGAWPNGRALTFRAKLPHEPQISGRRASRTGNRIQERNGIGARRRRRGSTLAAECQFMI
jgi:hypothetical protein